MKLPKACVSVDRRQFLGYAAGLGATIGLAGNIFAQEQPTRADNRLPDGTDFVSWEQPLTFSRTYYVDNGSSRADDNGPGSKERPFRTIGKAARVLQAGQRVVIASGTYRECVRPERGGTGPGTMISYEAASGAKVHLKGSEVFTQGWTQDPAVSVRRAAADVSAAAAPSPQVPSWGYRFTGATFPDAYNPFALASVAGDRAWLDTKAVDMGPYFRRRGLVFMDGKPLEPVELQRELVSARLYTPPPVGTPLPLNGLPVRLRGGPMMQEVGGTEDGRFWPDANGQSVHVRLANGTPADHMIEVTTREQVFVPANPGLSYIRVKGLIFEHAGNGFPLPQRGAMVDVMGGDHWIIEDNTIEWANAIGLEIGSGGGGTQPAQAHIVRRNTIRYCGVEGIAGLGTRDVLVEDNLIEWCGWADAEREWESAGAKFHSAHNMLFRRNVIRHIRHGNGVWFDSANVNCRISGNVFGDIVTVSAAVHMEVNLQQNQIDNNIIWDVRNSEPGTPGQRGCAGSGIFINASDKVAIAQNLIGRCDNSGVFAIVRPDRAGTGTASDNSVYNNIFTKCDRSAIVFLTPRNQAEGNVYAGMPFQFLGFFTGDSKQFLSLAAWRDAHGWDMTSVVEEMQIDFDPDRLELKISGGPSLPRMSVFNHLERDMFGKGAGELRFPGPLADLRAQAVWRVDPRVGIA